MNEENAPFNEWLEDFRQFADETAQKCAPKQRKWVRFRTQTIRKWFVNSLSELYESALEQSKNTELTVTQKERWSRLTAYIAQTINVILNAYDEVAIEKAIHDLKEYVKKHVETP
jgi:hypothetical protein